MASSSVSFRITRNTHDLAETIHALSQRLVSLEQRLAAIEGEMALFVEQEEIVDPDQIESLENVERLLRDCRDLLDSTPASSGRGVGHSDDDDEAYVSAA